MKILFITSGQAGIYKWLETWIQTELKKKHEVKFFDFKDGLSTLKTITQLFKPEVALTLVGNFPTVMVQWLKQQGIRTAVWLTEDPYYMDRTSVLVDHYDHMFTIDTAALEYYQKRGHKKTYHLPLGVNPEVFKPKKVEAKYMSDICLVGFPYPDRVRYVQLFLHNTSYKISVVGNWRRLLRSFRRSPNLLIYEGWAEPKIVADFYNGAKIVLNTHRPFNLNYNQNQLGVAGKSINNRTFDIAACAAFQLIDFKEDLPNHFIEDEEIVSYKKFEELIEKTQYYIQNGEERKIIANKARERVLKEHTLQHRLEKMISLINGSLS